VYLNTTCGFLNGYGFWITNRLNKFKVGFDSQKAKVPDLSLTLLKDVTLETSGFIVRKVQLRQYVISTDPDFGEYSLITVLIETDKGCIEMKYDEGYKEKGILNVFARFLANYVGYTSLITRAIMELQTFLT